MTSKNVQKDNQQKDNQQKEKRKKVCIFKRIVRKCQASFENSKDMKPSEYYEKFLEENAEMIEREKGGLNFETDNEEHDTLFEAKLKKMMKNQYYMMFQKGK